MALKVLRLRKRLNDRTAQLEQLRADAAALDARETQLEADIEAAETEEDQAAVDTAIDAFNADRDANDAAIAAAEADIQTLTDELSAAEASAQEARNNNPASSGNERRNNPMPQNPETRTRFFGMTIQQRDAFLARTDVTEFLTRTREMLGQRRGVTGAELGIPDVMLDVLRDNLHRYSKLITKVRMKPVPGKARQNIWGTVPEGVWMETAAAALNELTLTVSQVEVDGYLVGGYIVISNSYLEDDSNLGLATEIMDQLGQAIGLAVDKAIVYGTGTKMPVGIVTRLAAASKPAWWGEKQGAFTTLSTSNIKMLNLSANSGKDFYAPLLSALGVVKANYSNGGKVWVMNETTHTDLQVKAMEFNSSAALVAGMQNTMPIIGGEIVELPFIPDNTIIGGYLDLYLLVERAGAKVEPSEHARFLQNQTAFRGLARYDGKPLIGEGFVAVRYDNNAVATTMTFAPDTANTTDTGDTTATTDTGDTE